MNSQIVALISSIAVLSGAEASDGMAAALRQSGCYLVDYNFTETKSLKTGYSRDERVYNTNADKTTFELIVARLKSPTEIRLQHILFTKDLKSGKTQGMIKHQAEDWSYAPGYRYDFVSPGEWKVVATNSANNWVRKITNLDDGLRYQCDAAWDFTGAVPTWSCDNYAPIPGRETRDMGRKDYNTLQRRSTVKLYQNSWVEHQVNTKIIWDNGHKTPLAQESGRTWFIRQPDDQCREAEQYAKDNSEYWTALMEVWEEFYALKQAWSEKKTVNDVSRLMAMYELEEKYAMQLQQNPNLKETVKAEIRKVISAYRN